MKVDIPRFWYNVNADSRFTPCPVLNPTTMETVTPDYLSALFPWG
jgi:predicted alternative tryptophan synthase beta-subunit